MRERERKTKKKKKKSSVGHPLDVFFGGGAGHTGVNSIGQVTEFLLPTHSW